LQKRRRDQVLEDQCRFPFRRSLRQFLKLAKLNFDLSARGHGESGVAGDIPMALYDGGFNFQSNGSNICKFQTQVAITTYGNITGNSALAVAAGGTNQSLALQASGTGAVNVGTGTALVFKYLIPAPLLQTYVTVKGASTGNAPSSATAGTDTISISSYLPKALAMSVSGRTSPSIC